jgi:Uma2 family endonuclease
MNQQVRILPGESWRVAFTADDFERMMRLGAFADMRAELAGGRLEKMMPALPSHGERNVSIGAKLREAIADRPLRVASDLAIRIDETTVRAADIAIYPAELDADRVPEGGSILLVVEIADTTVSRDLGVKRVDYGRGGVAHYWVIDAAARVTHVMREPNAEGYGTRDVVRFGDPLPVPGTGKRIVID